MDIYWNNAIRILCKLSNKIAALVFRDKKENSIVGVAGLRIIEQQRVPLPSPSIARLVPHSEVKWISDPDRGYCRGIVNYVIQT